MQKLRQFLNQPYPDTDDLRSIIVGSFIAGLVVALVLLIFQPFGFDRAGEQAWKYALMFGLISFVVAVIFECIIKYVFKIERDKPSWVLWKWMLMILILIFLIALANLGYMKIFGINSGINFLDSLYVTVVVGIIPIGIIGAEKTIRNLKLNQNIAKEIVPIPKPNPVQLVSIPILKSEMFYERDVSKIIYAEAMQNYVHIYMHGEEEKLIVRNTLSNIEQILAPFQIIRSHRSFLVNTAYIKNVSGNAQGLKLDVGLGEDRIVPVSRKYIQVFK